MDNSELLLQINQHLMEIKEASGRTEANVELLLENRNQVNIKIEKLEESHNRQRGFVKAVSVGGAILSFVISVLFGIHH